MIQILSGKEGQELLADSGFSMPAYKGTEGGWLKSIPSLDLQVFVDSLEFAVPYPVSQNRRVAGRGSEGNPGRFPRQENV